MLAVDHVAAVLLTRLLWTSVQAMILVGLVSLLIWLLPRMAPTIRCVLWWLIGLQVIFGLCWQAPVSVPAITTPASSTRIFFRHDSGPLSGAVDLAFSASMASSSSPSHSTDTDQSPFISRAKAFAGHWRVWLAALWVLALTAQLPVLAAQRRRLFALSRNARPADDALQIVCDRLARQMRLRRTPEVLVSQEIASPLITGLWRPLILWPAEHALTDDEAELALTHELAHLKRGDLWFGMVPALAQWLFFFHPLVRRAVREYALCREAACDAQVLAFGSAPREYGEMLLRMGVAQPLRCGLGGASSTFDHLKRRLLILSQQPSTSARLCGWLFVAIVLAAALPYRAVIAGSSSALARGTDRTTNSPATAPSRLAAAMPRLPRFPDTGFNAHHVHVDIDSKAPVGIALFDGDLVVVEGDDTDMASARHMYNESRGPTLWFRQGSAAYLSHDPATIDRARTIYAPVIAMRQKAASLDGEKWQLKGPLEGLQSRRRDVDERIRKLQADPTAPAAAERLASLNDQKRDIDSDMADFARRLAAMKPQRDAMSTQLQQVTAHANKQVAQLVNEAVKAGNAQKASS